MDLTGKKVVVFGLGVSGKAVISFLQAHALETLIVVSNSDPDSWELESELFAPFSQVVKLHQDHAVDQLASSDLIILSPGIPRDHDALSAANESSVPVWNEVELAYHYFKGSIVAVTGTNGKTTTVSFLAQAFELAGKKVFLGGNIGVPFVNAISGAYDVAILELSSFQCESLDQFKANAYLYLNLYENHGERYDDMNDYRLAKWQMVKNADENSFIVVGPGAGESPFPKLKSSIKVIGDNWDEKFQELFNMSDMLVVGAHNRFNFYSAYLLYDYLNLPQEAFVNALKTFSGVEHRLERLETKQIIFNDAKSTNTLALETAVKAVYEKYGKHTLIMGGRKRHDQDLPSDENLSLLKKCCHRILCIGESAKDLVSIDSDLFYNVKNLVGAKETLISDEIVLFSPGYPSFDQFENYIDRGLSFKKVIGVIHES